MPTNLKPKAILFIGFRHKTESILEAKELGFKTILLTEELKPEAKGIFDDAYEGNLFDIAVIQKLIKTLKANYRIRGIISNYEHYVVTRSYLAEHFRLPASSIYSACCSRNKAMQRHALNFMNENIPFRIVKTLKQAEKALKTLGGDTFLKAISGIKSRLVFHVQNEKALETAFKELTNTSRSIDLDLENDYTYCNFNFNYLNPKTTFLMEKAIQGNQVTVASLVGGHKLWNAPSICDVYTAADLGRPDSFLAFRILPSKVSPEIQNKVKRAAETAARILGLQYCPIHAELIITPENEVKLIEIASRMGGYRPQMYKEAYDLNLNRLMIDAALGKEIKKSGRLKSHVSLLEIFPEKEGEFISLENYESLKNDPSVTYSQLDAKPGDKVGFAKHGHKTIARLLIKANSYEKVYEKSIHYQTLLKVKIKR
ncbi:MAG: ATP-grasp domain-containing protein [Candidatus Peregrinibacteria bacterium]|nr:ATP-grasp domain-containing protein [Candidatus Peregrinibacteria bacterium]